LKYWVMPGNRLKLWLFALMICPLLLALAEESRPERIFTLQDEKANEEGHGSLEGVSSMALGPNGKIWLVDNQESCLKVFEQDGSLAGRIELPGYTHDLAVGADGSIALLRLHLGRIDLLTPEGKPAGVMDLSIHLGPVRNIGFAPAGGLEVVNAHGERFLLGEPDRPRNLREILLTRERGPLGTRDQCGVRVEEGGFAIHRYLDRDEGTGRERSYAVEHVEFPGARAVHMLSGCADGNLLFEVEREDEHRTESVSRELIDVVGGKAWTVWRQDAPVVLHRSFSRAAVGGSVVVWFHPGEDGLEVWRWRRP
jgi:hypothetical protein